MDTELTLDGNALGGLLQQLFALEATAGHAACAACGAVNPIGAEVAYTHAPGAVVRCRNCTSVLMVVVRTRRSYRIGFERLRWLELDDPAP